MFARIPPRAFSQLPMVRYEHVRVRSFFDKDPRIQIWGLRKRILCGNVHWDTFWQCSLSQLPVVRPEQVRSFVDSTQSQKSKSEVWTQEFHVAMHIKTPLDNALYLSSLWSDLSMWGHFLIVLNLRNPNLRSAHKNFVRQCTLRHF